MDTLTTNSVYSPKPGAITDQGLGVKTSNYITFEPQTIYTISFQPTHMIPKNGKIILTFPTTEFGMSSQPSQPGDYKAQVGPIDKSLSQVTINRGIGQIELLDAFPD